MTRKWILLWKVAFSSKEISPNSNRSSHLMTWKLSQLPFFPFIWITAIHIIWELARQKIKSVLSIFLIRQTIIIIQDILSDNAVVMNDFKMNVVKMLKQLQELLVKAWFKTHSETIEKCITDKSRCNPQDNCSSS